VNRSAQGCDLLFLSHTAQPGGAELGLRRYLDRTDLHPALLSLGDGPAWGGLGQTVEVRPACGLWRQASVVRRHLEVTRPRVVVANTMRAALLAAVMAPRGVHLTYWVRDGLTEGAMSWLARTMTRYVTLPRTDHFIANSHWTAGSVLALRPDAGITVIPTCCGVGKFTVEHAYPRAFPASRPLRILYLGRLAKWKAPHVVIRGAQRLAAAGFPCEVTIAGAALFGEERYERLLAREASSATVPVSMIGHEDDVQGLLATHDVLVHSAVQPEPFGQVIVQAMAQGVPVVATDSGGPAEILDEGRWGALYAPGDVGQLTLRLLELCDAQRYQEASRAGLQRAMAYTDEQSTRMTDALLTQLISSTHHGRAP
jgi:glycosyltransferase involved in cell wall biosynthesis